METCKNCGAQLITNARFCHSCGEKIIITDCKSERSKLEVLKNNGYSKFDSNELDRRLGGQESRLTVTILGSHLRFPDKIAKLKTLRYKFHQLAEENVNRYRDYEENYIKCFDDIYEYGIPFVVELICAAIESAVQIAKDFGIPDMNYEWLAGLYEEQEDYNTYFSSYEEIAKSVVEMTVELTNNREFLKSNRVHWHGGGFGIIGAIKGHIGASALNLGTNIVKEAEYAIRDARDRGKIQKLKENVYYKAGMRKNLSMITYCCSFMTYYVLLPILQEAGLVSEDAEDIVQMENEVETTYEAYLGAECSYQKLEQILLSSINKNPFYTLPYVYLGIANRDAIMDIETAIAFFDLKYIYTFDKEALLFKWCEIVKDTSETNIKAIRKKIKRLTILEENHFITKDEIQNLKADLKVAWLKQIMLMQEYSVDEIGKKIDEYCEMKKTYENSWHVQGYEAKDLKRLKHKYAKNIQFEHIELYLDEVTAEKKHIYQIISNYQYDLLWHEVDKQNGYAQAVLYEFYIDKAGKGKEKINSVDQIRKQLPYLDQKLNEENPFAQFIYSAIVTQIEMDNNMNDAEKARIIHATFLREINKAIDAGIVFAMFCYLDEMFYRESWNVLCVYLEKTIKAFIPQAVSKLSSLYSWKNEDGMEQSFYKQKELLCEIEKELGKKEELEVLKFRYEKKYIVCPKCRNIIKIDKKFCSQCGTRVM